MSTIKSSDTGYKVRSFFRRGTTNDNVTMYTPIDFQRIKRGCIRRETLRMSSQTVRTTWGPARPLNCAFRPVERESKHQIRRDQKIRQPTVLTCVCTPNLVSEGQTASSGTGNRVCFSRLNAVRIIRITAFTTPAPPPLDSSLNSNNSLITAIAPASRAPISTASRAPRCDRRGPALGRGTVRGARAGAGPRRRQRDS